MGNRIRRLGGIWRSLVFQWYLKPQLGSCGSDVVIEDHFRVLGIERLHLGNHVFINHHVELVAAESQITIGNQVRLGQYVRVLTLVHGTKDLKTPMFDQEASFLPVVIEDDVWIGANATILPGVTIHHGAVVGAGAVVAKDVSAFSIVGGVPARAIKKR